MLAVIIFANQTLKRKTFESETVALKKIITI